MYLIDNIQKELKTFKTTEEKRAFIQKTIENLKILELKSPSNKPIKRVEHSKERIKYLEVVLMLRNLMTESFFEEKQ